MKEKTKEPINYCVEAKPHTPIYRMHRYFARRPYSVFKELISYYTDEKEIVLDPFCGGGVTVVEGLKLKRKAIGVDLNPMATFITKSEIMQIDLIKFKKIFDNISKKISEKIEGFYMTHCPQCKAPVSSDWVEWSHVYECPNCMKRALIFCCEKKGSGKYKCNLCNQDFITTNSKRVGEEITRINLRCNKCGFKGTKKPDKFDINNDKKVKNNFLGYIKLYNLWYPTEEMPMEYDLRRPYNYQMKKFTDFLTKRNLLSLAILFKEIKEIEDSNLKYLMLNVFTSTLSWVTKVCVDPGHGWPISAYWVANINYEINVWKQFSKRFKWFLRGKSESSKEIGSYFQEAASFDQLKSNATAWILTQSASKLKIPDDSIDAIITDPPYGGNVMYSELSNFYLIWLKGLFDFKETFSTEEEAIINDYQKKDWKNYEELLFRVFKECYRVLKPGKWMVMTFNNKESSVWIALLRAAQRAGFYLPEEGVIYQEPIKHYTNTLYQRREGSVLGDFIYSFQKRELYNIHPIQLTNGKIRGIVYDVALNVISKNKGATTSEIYQHIIPCLFNNYIIVGEKEIIPDVEQILREKFKHEIINNIKKWVSN